MEVVILVKLIICIFAIALAATPVYANNPIERIPVLNYHSIMSQEFYYPLNVDNPWILSEEVFYQQMRFLYENNFTTLTADQLKDFLFYDGTLPPNPVILTFDDGYLDNYLFAAPILRQFGFTGMVFLITSAFPETTPRMTAFPTQFMSLTEINASADVFEYGSHTHDMHRNINGRPALRVESVENIRADIRQSFDNAPLTFKCFAYPFGAYSNAAISALKEEGVQFAFSTRWGTIHRDTNPFLLPRFCVTSEWTMEFFESLLLP